MVEDDTVNEEEVDDETVNEEEASEYEEVSEYRG